MPDRKHTRASPASPRLWIYRALAVVGIPVALFLGLEGALRLAGFGRPAGFLIPDDQPGYVRTNPDFAGLFLPGNFELRPLNFRVAIRKPADTVRIVVLGESAAQGIPVPHFGFAAQLRAQLRARYPGKNVEILNTGIVAINSHVIYQIARDLAAFSPDLFVVYAGNNEVVGPYGPGCAYLSDMPPLWLIRLSVGVRSTRTGQLLGAVLSRLGARSRPPAEWGGMSMFVDHAVGGDDPRLETVYRNFAENLRDVVRVATNAGAKTLLCTVVSNLKDCAPLLSLHRPGLAPADLAAWQQAFERGRIGWLLDDAAAARPALQEALRLDPQYADTSFMLGTLELEAGDLDGARQHLLAAAHWDALRFRPDPRINEIIREVASAGPTAVSLLDTASLLGSDPASSAAPPGRELLFEHVHLDWEGNFLLARSVAQAAEAALFGGGHDRPPWLDSPGCAAALAYTPAERPAVLQKISLIIQNPPFTNQLTYVEDQARWARDLARAQAEHRDPAALRHAREAVQAAAARDPENPALAKIEEDLAEALGDDAGALGQAQRAQRLQPRTAALAGDEALRLSRLGRYDEAKRLLPPTTAAGAPGDVAVMAPAHADFFVRTKRFDEGRRYFEAAVSRYPGEVQLRLLRGRLAELAGDIAAAEGEYRAIRAADPRNQTALESLVSLLNAQGRQADAAGESVAAAEQQPRNQANNLRAAIIEESRGNDAPALRLLLAAEKSGPVTSGIELRLAQKYFRLGQREESLVHLALAKRLSAYEGDPAITDSIGQLIAQIRSELR